MGLLAVVFLLAAWAGVTTPGRAAVKALLFIPEIIPSAPLHPQEWVTGTPTHQKVRFPVGGGEGDGDLYIPAGEGKHPAVVLFFGIIPAGPDDPRIVNLADGLARSNMVVLIPWSPVMTASYRLDPAAVGLLVDAFNYLKARPDVDPARIGMAGFCVGASFALMAAEDDGIRDEVAYVNDFGGYYNAQDLLVAIASHARFYGGASEPWQPRDDTRRVFATHLIESLDSQEERNALAQVFLEGGTPAQLDTSRLSEQGNVVYKLLSGVSLEEAGALLKALPPAFLSELDAVSPSTRIAALKAPVLIMHDREDTAIPSPESHRLAGALAKRGHVYYTEFSLFQHVDPTRPLPPPDMARELWKLLVHMYHVMLLGT